MASISAMAALKLHGVAKSENARFESESTCYHGGYRSLIVAA
jgi:hypothetical protein